LQLVVQPGVGSDGRVWQGRADSTLAFSAIFAGLRAAMDRTFVRWWLVGSDCRAISKCFLHRLLDKSTRQYIALVG
jgi:hypothetical protein